MKKQYLAYRLLPFILLICPMFLAGQSDEFASTVHIRSFFDTLTLPPIQWIYKEETKTLTIEDVKAGNFKDATKINLSDGNSFFSTRHRAFWFKVRISSEIQTRPFGLAFYSNGDCWPFEPTFKTLETWQIDANGDIKGYSGTAATFSERDYPQHLFPSMIKVDMMGKDTVDIWCKVIRAMGCNIHADVEILANHITNQYRLETKYLFWHNILRGACITLFIIGLVLYFWFREPVFLWFTTFQMLIIIQRLFTDVASDIYLNFLPESPRMINLLLGICGAFTLSSLLQFGRVYINTKEKFPRIHRLLFVIMVSICTLAIIGTFIRLIPAFSFHGWYGFNRRIMIMVMTSCVSIFIYLLFSRDKLAIVFSIGATAPCFALLWGMINVYIFKNSLKSLSADFVLNLGYVLSLTIALIYRFKLIIEERENAISEKSKAELARNQQVLKMEISSNFFSNITHEFRTPLTLILEPIRQILQSQPNNPNTEKLTLVKGNSEKLLSLVNQLLDLSKIEQNQMQLDLQFNDIHIVTRPIFDSFKVLAEKKGVQLKMKGSKKISGFLFDQQKMERIIFNLLSNAIKFTEQGSVELHLLEKEKQLSIIVQDTGIGIAQENLPYIFNRFHQLDSSSTRRNEGTGIGLALVKELVELMKGSVVVESKEEDGTRFTVMIPMNGLENQNLSQNKLTDKSTLKPLVPTILNASEKSENTDQAIVLIVEDNHELRAFVRQSLDTNYQIIEASNGQEGIDKAKQLIPDLIVSDVMMPQKDGLELTHELKQDELTSHIPIILLTAKSKVDSKIKGLSFGADAYVTKPFNTNELLIRIAKLIELRQLLQSKYSRQISIPFTPIKSEKQTDKEKNALGQIDQDFLRKLNLILHEYMSDPDLSVEAVAKKVFMSRSQLFRKVKALTGESPTNFIRNFRLDQAQQLLKDQQGSVTEICEQVGFGNEKYFVSRFKERFGVSPRKL